jgi:hypothetical protein
MPWSRFSGGVIPVRRPSVLSAGGVVRIVFERGSTVPGMAQDVVVATLLSEGAFVDEVVTSTPRTGRLDPVLHAAAGHLWVDWKHGESEFGCAEHGESGRVLGVPAPWTDPSWVGVEETRGLVRQQVVGP